MMQILYPAFAMMALTIFCMVRLGLLRWVAVGRGEVDPRFFRLFRGYEEPEKLAAYSRHVVNLFEAPLLFYVIILTAFATGQSGNWLAGAGVGLRCASILPQLCAFDVKCCADTIPHFRCQYADAVNTVGGRSD